jgi:hypothetical protein
MWSGFAAPDSGTLDSRAFWEGRGFVPLSSRAGLLILGVSLAFSAPAHADQAKATSAQVDYDWVDALERRIGKLLPSLLGSLSAARREREPALVRCFDRAVSELHSVERQVSYHADRLELTDRATLARHRRALLLLQTRVDELSRSGVSCFTDGTVSRPGETHVEVLYVVR